MQQHDFYHKICILHLHSPVMILIFLLTLQKAPVVIPDVICETYCLILPGNFNENFTNDSFPLFIVIGHLMFNIHKP